MAGVELVLMRMGLSKNLGVPLLGGSLSGGTYSLGSILGVLDVLKHPAIVPCDAGCKSQNI